MPACRSWTASRSTRSTTRSWSTSAASCRTARALAATGAGRGSGSSTARSTATSSSATSATAASIPPGARAAAAPPAPRATFRRTASGELVEVRDVSAQYVLKEGESIISYTPGGGGYGPPRERDPALVAKDVREGWVGVERARDLYRVALGRRRRGRRCGHPRAAGRDRRGRGRSAGGPGRRGVRVPASHIAARMSRAMANPRIGACSLVLHRCNRRRWIPANQGNDVLARE